MLVARPVNRRLVGTPRRVRGSRVPRPARARDPHSRLRQPAGSTRRQPHETSVQEGRRPSPIATRTAANKRATMALFWGAIGVFKNPSSHREVNCDDPIVAPRPFSSPTFCSASSTPWQRRSRTERWKGRLAKGESGERRALTRVSNRGGRRCVSREGARRSAIAWPRAAESGRRALRRVLRPRPHLCRSRRRRSGT